MAGLAGDASRPEPRSSSGPVPMCLQAEVAGAARRLGSKALAITSRLAPSPPLLALCCAVIRRRVCGQPCRGLATALGVELIGDGSQQRGRGKA